MEAHGGSQARCRLWVMAQHTPGVPGAPGHCLAWWCLWKNYAVGRSSFSLGLKPNRQAGLYQVIILATG